MNVPFRMSISQLLLLQSKVMASNNLVSQSLNHINNRSVKNYLDEVANQIKNRKRCALTCNISICINKVNEIRVSLNVYVFPIERYSDPYL